MLEPVLDYLHGHRIELVSTFAGAVLFALLVRFLVLRLTASLRHETSELRLVREGLQAQVADLTAQVAQLTKENRILANKSTYYFEKFKTLVNKHNSVVNDFNELLKKSNTYFKESKEKATFVNVLSKKLGTLEQEINRLRKQ